jgi:hypothetical protein
MAHSTDIVGYTHQADNYCPACILTVLVGTHNVSTTDPEGEFGLTPIAINRGIDRDDEASFDSGGFPKVLFRDRLGDLYERCGRCGEELGE